MHPRIPSPTTRAASCCVAALTALWLCACSFDLAEHPASCQSSADCRAGYECYRKLCVEQTAVLPGTGGDSGSGANVPGDAAAHAGSGGSSTGPVAGSTATDSGAHATAGNGPSTPFDGGLGDAAGPDAAATVDGGPRVAPYASCGSDADCNPGDSCRLINGIGACGATCANSTECARPAGSYTAAPTCATDGHCRLDCAPSPPVPPFARTCPPNMQCLLEVGSQSCFPK